MWGCDLLIGVFAILEYLWLLLLNNIIIIIFFCIFKVFYDECYFYDEYYNKKSF